PSMRVRRPRSTVTFRLQQSGQSSGHAVVTVDRPHDWGGDTFTSTSDIQEILAGSGGDGAGWESGSCRVRSIDGTRRGFYGGSWRRTSRCERSETPASGS